MLKTDSIVPLKHQQAGVASHVGDGLDNGVKPHQGSQLASENGDRESVNE